MTIWQVRLHFVPLILAALTACSVDEKTVVQAIVSEKPQPTMALECHTDSYETFKPVKKTAGDNTPAEDALQALQSNKSRITRNAGRTQACECWVKDTLRNSDDMKRLETKCAAPVAPVATAAPAPATPAAAAKPAPAAAPTPAVPGLPAMPVPAKPPA